MPIGQELLEIIVCPETHQPLRIASDDEVRDWNARIAKGELKTVGGVAVKEPLQEALVREAGDLIYRIQDGIPVLLSTEGIRL